MSMDFARLNALAEGWMRTRQAHLERERGSVYFHGQRVAKGVLELRRRVTEDASHDEILRAAAIFHDIGKGIEPHAQSGAALVCGLLREEIAPQALAEIARLIAAHCDRRPREDAHDVWARLLQDADLLDHFGSYGIWMLSMNAANLSHGSIEALNEFYQNQYGEYIRKNRALLNFAQSLAVFDEKDAFVRQFASRLRVESAGGYCI